MKALPTTLRYGVAISMLALGLSACGSNTPSNPQTEDETLSGGATTILDATSASFSFPAPNLEGEDLTHHIDGDAAFEALFVAGGSINGGLGPIYNNTSCIGCHIQDGRGAPPGQGQQMSSMLIRLSLPGGEPNAGPVDVPGFGGQLQNRSLRWVNNGKGEATVSITYTPVYGKYADGTEYTLQKPTYTLSSPYRDIPSDVLMSPRVAPIVFGLGLLEAVPEGTILGFQDVDDRNGDGISGKANYCYDALNKKNSLGRFGAKSNTPSLLQQAAGAYNQDMGITSWVFPIESSKGQPQEPAPSDHPDVDSATLHAVTVYVQTLGVPARRNVNDPDVRAGQKLFSDGKCASCHIPTMRTGSTHEIAALRNQVIHPYTDLLVHDMGPELADNRPDFMANGQEWRTAALWGIGLTSIASGHTNFLHDGRARNIAEAILWHGGEGEFSREFFKNLDPKQRAQLLAFLQSL